MYKVSSYLFFTGNKHIIRPVIVHSSIKCHIHGDANYIVQLFRNSVDRLVNSGLCFLTTHFSSNRESHSQYIPGVPPQSERLQLLQPCTNEDFFFFGLR